jgi:potassium-dependent mechanosensitive channel
MELGRITIILGALGVGIGFGLQSIVNNLLSGVVLAFERPIEIGDQIEVAGRLGTIKEIGIRSSKLHNFDGSEVIIPNGDLLNQHVVNWTLSNNQRRVELILGVKYGSDLNKIKVLLEGILNDNPRIERYPLSMVLLNDFGDSSITFRLLFWTDVLIWIQVKSEVILAINECFNQNGIEIPFPQLDVHMKDSTSAAEEK